MRRRIIAREKECEGEGSSMKWEGSIKPEFRFHQRKGEKTNEQSKQNN